MTCAHVRESEAWLSFGNRGVPGGVPKVWGPFNWMRSAMVFRKGVQLGVFALLPLLADSTLASPIQPRSERSNGVESPVPTDAGAVKINAASYLPPAFTREVYRVTDSSDGLTRQWMDASGRILARRDEGVGLTLWAYDESGFRYSETFVPEGGDLELTGDDAPVEHSRTAFVDGSAHLLGERGVFGSGGAVGKLVDAVNSVAAVHFDYAQDGQVSLEKVTVDGISFEVRRTAAGTSGGYDWSDSQGGFFSERRDSADRLLSYSEGGTLLFQRAYDSVGHVLSNELGNGARVEYEGAGGGWSAKTVIPAVEGVQRRRLSLERDSKGAVTQLLINGVRFERPGIEHSTSVRRLYFDALGRVVKTVLNKEVTYNAYLVGGPYAVLDSSGVVVKRRLMTTSGDTAFAENGVEMFPDGTRQYLISSPLPEAGLLYSVHKDGRGAGAVSAQSAHLLVASSCYFWQTTSWDSNGNPTVTSHSMCWVDGGGGGGGSGGGSGGSAGGGTGEGSPLSSARQSAVNAAVNIALDRLTTRPSCTSLYGQYGTGAAGVAGVANITHANYVNGGAQGGPRCPADTLASTPPGTLTVSLCPNFFITVGGWTPTPLNQALAIIHESLHSNGLLGHVGLSSSDFQILKVDPVCR